MSAPYAAEMVEIATRLWGAPSETHSTAKETRFGSNGSKSIDLGKAVWFDHEADTGGNYRELFKLANGVYPTNGEDRSAVFRAPAGMVKELDGGTTTLLPAPASFGWYGSSRPAPTRHSGRAAPTAIAGSGN